MAALASPPRLFITDGCPFVLKVLTFLTDAKLLDRVAITPDAPEHRAFVTEKAGRRADFPARHLVHVLRPLLQKLRAGQLSSAM